MTHNDFVNGVLKRLKTMGTFDAEDVRNVLHVTLKNVKLVEESTELTVKDPDDRRADILGRFTACKMIEGCSMRTINYYANVLKAVLREIPKQIEEITTDDIRWWMAMRMQRDKISKTTQDNDRRVLNSFFAWCVENDVIVKNPMRTIKKVKQEKRVRKPFSDVEIERLRIAAQGNLRLTAMLEVMLSTGIRVGELVGLDRDSIDGDEAVVFGKGSKERVVYLNARARVALQMYEDTRPADDMEPALFAAMNRPYARLGISAVEVEVRELGKAAGVNDVHPHRFRRTAATMALNRGMPIDQVQQMLGHEQIATTLIYAKSTQEAVKQAHKKWM